MHRPGPVRTRSRNNISYECPSGGVRTAMSMHCQRSVMRGFNSMRLQGRPHIEAMHVLMMWYSHVSMIGGHNHHGERGPLTHRLRVGAGFVTWRRVEKHHSSTAPLSQDHPSQSPVRSGNLLCFTSGAPAEQVRRRRAGDAPACKGGVYIYWSQGTGLVGH